MPKQPRAICLLLVASGMGLSPLSMAWTPYGYSPYGPGYQGGSPEVAPPAAPTSQGGASEPSSPYPPAPTGESGSQWGYPYGAPGQGSPSGDASQGFEPPPPPYPGYGPGPGPGSFGGYPGPRGSSFGPANGMHISRATSPDAYELTIELTGASPQDIQVRAQGQSILISRESSTEQVQKDSFDNGRGYTRSFSYSSGTSSRRLRVPPDADLSAMSRTDAESSIHIRIPRVSR